MLGPLAQQLCAVLAVSISSVAGINYIYGVFRGQTRPHAFTWVVWALVMSIVCVAQSRHGAGAGAWATGSSALLCLSVFIAALFRGERNITRGDWAALVGALAIIPLWQLTENALLATLLAIAIDACAYAPTVRKAWRKPFEEDYVVYASDVLKWGLAFAAMQEFTLLTLLYPLFCLLANTGVAGMIVLRRRLVPCG